VDQSSEVLKPNSIHLSSALKNGSPQICKVSRSYLQFSNAVPRMFAGGSPSSLTISERSRGLATRHNRDRLGFSLLVSVGIPAPMVSSWFLPKSAQPSLLWRGHLLLNRPILRFALSRFPWLPNWNNRVFEVGCITCDNHVGVDKAGGFMQHRVLEIFKWQIQCTLQSSLVYGGDFEKRKQKRDTLTCLNSGEAFCCLQRKRFEIEQEIKDHVRVEEHSQRYFSSGWL
jgi:hypothetical protein